MWATSFFKRRALQNPNAMAKAVVVAAVVTAAVSALEREVNPPRGIGGLSNLGPRSQATLAAAGITSVESLRAVGAVAAYSRAKRAAGAHVSLNLLWALEGALTGLPWQVVAREHRTSLLLALEQHESERVPLKGPPE
jgi:DNA transformation protein and related proteins